MEEQLRQFEEFLVSEGKSRETIRHYILNVKALLQTVIDQKFLRSEMIGDYVSVQECPQSTKNQIVSSLRKFFKWLSRADLSCPKQKHIPIKSMLLITEDELPDICEQISYGFRDHLMFNALVFLIYYSGLRVKEILELRCEYFQMEGDILVLNFPYQGTSRKFYLHDDVRYLTTNGSFEDADIFNINVDKINRLFTRLSRYINMKDGRRISPRMLRDSFACNALHKGMSLETLQKLMLHRSIKTTRKYLKLMSQWTKKILDGEIAADIAKDKQVAIEQEEGESIK
jgi:site-specific recombinase XerD